MFSSAFRFYRSSQGILLLVLLGIWTSVSWSLKIEQTGLHKRDLAFAKALYSGHLVETPAYPMWGYPLLLGIVDNGVVIVQWAILLMLFPSMVGRVTWSSPVRQRFSSWVSSWPLCRSCARGG